MPQPRKVQRYGWKPDLPDFRDHLYAAPAPPAGGLPPLVDMRAQCPAVYDQGQLGSCHDANTEVLTEDGWMLFADLTGEERLASVDPKTSKLIYEKPTRVVRLPFNGELVVGRNELSLDFAVTPDHEMLVRKWDEAGRTLSSDYARVNAKDLGWYSGLMNRVSWAGEGNDTYTLPTVPSHKHKPQREPKQLSMGVWLQFLGIYLAEGTILQSDRHFKIQLAASKEREKSYIRGLMAEMGIHPLELTDRFTFENRQVYEEMTRLGLRGVYAPDKFVPAFVFKQSAENIKWLLRGHFMGDGSEQRTARAHYTSSAQLADDLQLLIFLSGDESRIAEREPRSSITTDGREITGRYPEHRVSVCESKNLSIERAESISRQHYEGEVFCAEVSTYHTLVTRRNRRILISGNCTANAIGAAFEFDQIKEKLAHIWRPSRLFIYYNERVIEGDVGQDAGAQIRDGIKSINVQGACSEDLWTYSDDTTSANPKFAQKPPDNCYTNAAQHLATSYQSVVQNIQQIKGCLASGYPVVFGFTVYDSFESQQVATTGILNMPGASEQVVGGHAVLCVGYDDSQQRILVRNSWSANWGQKGYFTMPYQYITDANLASDLWTVRFVQGTAKS